MANSTTKKQQGEMLCFMFGESNTLKSFLTTKGLILFEYKLFERFMFLIKIHCLLFFGFVFFFL